MADEGDEDRDVSDYDTGADGGFHSEAGGKEFNRSLDDAQAELESRKANKRQSLMDKVKFKLRNGWRHDDRILNQYFQSVVANWKVYKGTKKPNQVLKLQCIYRQAMFGDNTAPPPDNMKSISGLKWQGWTALKGTSQIVAKRRFITYLAEIDPHLIDVMPDEKPPDGFPIDHKTGEVICAKCNTKTGCGRPLLDSNKTDLRKQLFDFEYLHEPAALQKWVKHAYETQRCVWGIHMAVAKIDIKPFHGWFEREENGGYLPYDNTSVMSVLRELVHYHFEIAWDMQQNKGEYGAEAFNHQVQKVNKLQSTYEAMSGQRFVFEAPCKQNIAVCNDRRKGDGGRNHTHPVVLEDPTHKDVATYDEVMELRAQCKNLGLSITTGIVQNVQERRDIYRSRIANHFNAVATSAKAKERNENRPEIHRTEKNKVKELSGKMMVRQCWDACHALHMDQVMTLLRRGCDPNTESPRGLTPFLCAVLTSSDATVVEELVKLKANINGVNQFGFTPLILACRLRETKVIHVLMRSGASALQDSGRKGGGRTAIHTCAESGAEEELKIILDYVKDGGGDALRIVRLLDAQSDSGDTALMLAARIRNGLMCRVLTSMGANPNILNAQSRNACYMARSAGWTELADWLEKKVGAGVAKLETFSDLQYDKQVRYGAIKTREFLEMFGAHFLKTVHKSATRSPLGPPSNALVTVRECGDRAITEQVALLDMHQIYIMRRDPENRPFPASKNPNDPNEENVLEMLKALDGMYEQIRNGNAGPNTEPSPKPLAWSPLMCAAAMNDVKRVKLFIRSGASPNFRNRDGTSAVMLAAQLQCIEALVEMLVMGADLNQVDNQGFTALAYASSLPRPTNMSINGVRVLLDDDAQGKKRIDTSALIKLALKCGVGGLKRVVEANAIETSREAIVGHFQFMRLLEQYGLKRIDTIRHIHEQVATSDWRIDRLPEEIAYHGKTRGDEGSETSSEMREREAYERRRAAEADDEDDQMRCPVCTLVLPCSHFFKAEVLKSYLAKQTAETGSTGSGYLDMLAAAAQRMKDRKARQESVEQGILDEAGIGDRRTDRSVTLMKKYRARERELDRAMLLRMEAQRLEDEKLKLEEEKAAAKARAIADGTYVEWREFFNSYGQKFFVNSDTGEKWEEHISTDGAPYYHNPDTGESRWDSPVPKPVVLAIAPVVEEAAVETAVVEQQPSEEEKRDKGMKLMGEADTSAKALALDLSSLEPEAPPAPKTARKTYTMPAEYKRKSALKNSGVEYLIGPDGMATAIPVENLHKETEPVEAPEVLRPRRVKFKGVPGDDKQPFEFLDLQALPVVDWGDIKKTPRGGEPEPEPELEPEPEPELTEFQPEPGLESEAGDRSHLGYDDDLESIGSAPVGGAKSQSKDKDKDKDGESYESDISHLMSDSLSSSSTASLQSLQSLQSLSSSTLPLDPVAAKFERMRRNPVPPEMRRLYMFTADPITRFGQADGLLTSAKSPKPMPLNPKEVVSRMRRLGTPVPIHLMELYRKELEHEDELRKEEQHRARLKEQGKEPEKPRPMPFYPTGLAARKQSELQSLAGNQGDAQIQVSGWLFISLEAIETSVAPQERISLRPEVWANVLEQVRGKMINDWLPRCSLEPLVSPKTWKVDAPRCCVCCVGFVRFFLEKRSNELFKATMAPKTHTVVGYTVFDHEAGTWSSTAPDGSFEYNEYNLCFPCLVRRELYERVQATFPRTQRTKMASSSQHTWPFKAVGVAAKPTAASSDRGGGGGGGGVGQEDDYFQRLSSSDQAQLPGLGFGLGHGHGASLSSIDSSYSNIIAEGPIDLKDLLAMSSIASASQSFGGAPPRSPGSSFSVAAKSPTTSSKLRLIDSIESMRRAGLPVSMGGSGSLENLRVGFGDDDSASLGAGSLLSEDEMADSFDELGLDATDVGSVGSVGSIGSGSVTGGGISPKGSRKKPNPADTLTKGGWEEAGVEVYTSAAEKRAAAAKAEKGQEKKQTLKEKLSFGKPKKSLFNDSLLSSGPTSLSLVTIPSQFSGSTADARVPPKTDKRRPAEILLLPFLVSRGHFEEVERTVRIVISRSTVDEGEGMLLLLKVFQYQADMYKLMGLFPLALAVYLDSVDLTASLLGFANQSTTSATVCVSSCLRKMHLPALAKTFIANCCHRLEEETFSNSTFAASKQLLESDRRFKKSFMRTEDIWTKMVSSTRPECIPQRDHKLLIWETAGLGALYRCLSAVDGQGIVTRAGFVHHCDRVDPNGLGRFAQYVAYCFRLRLVDAPDIFRHFVQTLIQKQLAKSLLKTSDVARLYRHVTSPEHISAVVTFLKEGISVSVEAFDEMLFHCMRVLVPAFAIFLLRHGGAGMRENSPEVTAQALHGYAVCVQVRWRGTLARIKVKKMKDGIAEAKRKKEEQERELEMEIELAKLSQDQNKLGWQQPKFKPGKFKSFK